MAEDYELRLDERVAQLLGVPRGAEITERLLLVAILRELAKIGRALDRIADAPHPW